MQCKKIRINTTSNLKDTMSKKSANKRKKQPSSKSPEPAQKKGKQNQSTSTMKGRQRSAPPSPLPSETESTGDSYVSSSSSRSSSPSTPSITTRPKLPPPFFLTLKPEYPWRVIAKELFSIPGHELVTAKTTPKPNEIKLNCQDENTFRSVQNYLTSIKDKIGFHTHPLPEQKNLKIVIKGLPLDISNEEISEELTNLGFKPTFIRAFIKNDKRLPIHQITLADLETAKDIYQIQETFLCQRQN